MAEMTRQELWAMKLTEQHKIPMWKIRYIHEKMGYYFFTRDSMRQFQSKIESKEAYVKGDNAYFLTSEKFNDDSPRKYSIHYLNLKDGTIEVEVPFRRYDTKSDALYALRQIVPRKKPTRRRL
jgi:hypothetical protein